MITNIGLDHTQFLGSTIKEIAHEKAGIIKENVPVVIGEAQPETKEVFVEHSKEKNAPIVFASEEFEGEVLESDLLGAYQKNNQKTALCILPFLLDNGFHISDADIKNGLNNVSKLTGLQDDGKSLTINH